MCSSDFKIGEVDCNLTRIIFKFCQTSWVVNSMNGCQSLSVFLPLAAFDVSIEKWIPIESMLFYNATAD